MEYFSEVEDPRRETKNKKYPLIEVIVIAFLAVMSGADGWESIGVVESNRDAGEGVKPDGGILFENLV
ncbi:MAG: transposase family protein [Treponema sp.]|nr:transposase family protein [Treponema sp.]